MNLIITIKNWVYEVEVLDFTRPTPSNNYDPYEDGNLDYVTNSITNIGKATVDGLVDSNVLDYKVFDAAIDYDNERELDYFLDREAS